MRLLQEACALQEVEEAKRAQQEARARQVLTPLYRAALAHPASLLPAPLLFFATDYGELSAHLARSFVKTTREADPACCLRAIRAALEFAFSTFKRSAQEAQEAREVKYVHFVRLCKRLAALLGIQLSYDLLVALFDMMRVGVGSRCEA